MTEPSSTSAGKLPSLLDEPGTAPPAPAGPDRPRERRWHALARDRRVRRTGVVAAVVLVVLGGSFTARALWPRPVPDYLNDPMDEVLDFTLLSREFNTLPIERRLELIKDLIARLKNMSSSDSVLMASFAGRLQAEARKQIEENAKRLAVDTLDMFADEYTSVAPQDRARFLDDMLVDFTRMMEDIGGDASGLPEDREERLAALRRQAQRDAERAQEGDTRMRAEQVAGFLRFLNQDADKVASPVQQARLTRMTRDLTRHLRGQDLDTGLPKPRGR